MSANLTRAPGAVVTLEEKCRFDLLGFLVLPGVLTAQECAALLGEVHRLEKQKTGDLEKHDQVRIDGLPQRHSVFDLAVGHARLLPYLHEFLEEPQLVNTWAISKGPRADISRWHRGLDSKNYSCINGVIRTKMLNTAWLLTDNNPGEGGLGVLPASHKNNIDLDWPSYRGLTLPGSIEVTGRAGDVVVFSECLIHEGLPKTTPGARTNLYFNHIERSEAQKQFSSPEEAAPYRFAADVRARFNSDQRDLTQWMEQP